MSKQTWEIGQTVRVGFLSLTITGRESLEDREDRYMPRAWFLESSKGIIQYSFTPHNGLERLSA